MRRRSTTSEDFAYLLGGLVRADWRFGILFSAPCFAGSLGLLPGEFERLAQSENGILWMAFYEFTPLLIFAPSIVLFLFGAFLLALAFHAHAREDLSWPW